MCQFMSGAWNNFFKKIVHAFVEAVIFDIDPRHEKQMVDGAARFISSVHASMQPFYRFGLVVLAAVFSFYAVIRSGRRFSGLSSERRLQLMQEWLKSPVGIMRDFIRFFLNLTLFFYYDSADTLRLLGVDTKSYRKIQCFYAGN